MAMRNETPSVRRLTPAEVEARIAVHVAQLRVTAAETALGYARMRTLEAFRALDMDMDD
jgi:hypothetical protein